jgi:GT2 family glycosyltransferase
VRRTDCEFVALLNPDAFPEPDWLERLVDAALAAPRHASFTSRLVLAADAGVLDGEGDSYGVNGFAWRRHHGLPVAAGDDARGEVFSACAAAALYRRDAFLATGAFDERFFTYLEDVDLGFRLRLRGAGCLYVPESVAHHVGSGLTGRTSDFSVYHAQRNLVWTFVKDMPGPLLWIYLPQHLLLNLAAIGWYVMQGQGGTILRAKLDALRGLRAVWVDRKRVQSLRTESPAALRREMVKGSRAFAAALGRASAS